MMTTIILDFQNCFIFIFLCLSSLLCYTLFFRKPKDFPLPPSPPSLPIIGHLHFLLSVLVHRSLQKLSSKYGSILYLHIFSSPIVLVSSASAAYEIFRAHDVNISSRGLPPTEASLFAGSFSFISASKWRLLEVHGRRTSGSSSGHEKFCADELGQFYDNLFKKALKKETVEIFEEALKLTNNSICKLIMGRCCPDEEDVMERVKGLVTELDVLSKKILFGKTCCPHGYRSLFSHFLKRKRSSFKQLQ
ncbi:hypothetical protein Rs2_47029 [Raphanus sativus]|nr:hypothetical protein Rs2_47029 [Raphanus sativus]